MAVWMALLMTSIAVFPAVTATSALLRVGRQDSNQPVTQATASNTSAPAAAGTLAADAAAAKSAPAAPAVPAVDAAAAQSAPAAPAVPAVTAVTSAPATPPGAKTPVSNYVAYQPDDFYEKEFASDSDNPLEELSFSAGYPTSRPLDGTVAGNSTQVAAAETPKETPKEMSEETAKTENANASAVQLTAPLSACSTRKDTRVAAWFAETAPEGSACVFGVDSRDEGGHCILDSGKYGSHGWCYTAQDASMWGSCDMNCPAHGSAAKVAEKIDVLANAVGLLKSRVAAAKTAQVIPGAKGNALLQQNNTLLQRGRNSEDGPIEWIQSWFSSSDLNESAQIAVSTDKDSAGSTKRGQVVAVPLQSQLLQQSPASPPPANSSAIELSGIKQHDEGNEVPGVVAVKLDSQLLQKQSAPKSKEGGAVVAVKLQSQLLQKRTTPKSQEGKTSFMHARSRKKAAHRGKTNKTKKGVVVVKLQSQL